MFAPDNSASYGIQLTLSTGVLVLLLDRAVVLIKAWRGNGHGSGTNGKSGDMPLSYWQMQMRDGLSAAYAEHLAPLLEKQNTVLEEIRDAEIKRADRLNEILIHVRDLKAGQKIRTDK